MSSFPTLFFDSQLSFLRLCHVDRSCWIQGLGAPSHFLHCLFPSNCVPVLLITLHRTGAGTFASARLSHLVRITQPCWPTLNPVSSSSHCFHTWMEHYTVRLVMTQRLLWGTTSPRGLSREISDAEWTHLLSSLQYLFSACHEVVANGVTQALFHNFICLSSCMLL